MALKSHFTFTKEQRNGIFLLLIIIVLLQLIYFFLDYPAKSMEVQENELLEIQKQIDSLKSLKLEEEKFESHAFNPNFINDYKGDLLGMSPKQIDRLLDYRRKGKWINSAEQFQEVTKVSDSLLGVIAPYFKFPEWVSNKTQKKDSYKKKLKTFSEKQDLNKVTAKELQVINGIGEKLSERIIRYRNSFPGGFIDDIQLTDVYGLKPEVIKRITQEFTVKTPRKIDKLDLNTATVADLVRIQHIDYDIANSIVEYRLFNEKFKTLNDLTKVKHFPDDKIDIIRLYLHLEKKINE